MPCGMRATSAVANTRLAPGRERTGPYLETIEPRLSRGGVYDGPALEREVIGDLDVLERLVPVSGRDVVDVGCGGGALVRALAARGARMTGVEISESQLAAAVRDDA